MKGLGSVVKYSYLKEQHLWCLLEWEFVGV